LSQTTLLALVLVPFTAALVTTLLIPPLIGVATRRGWVAKLGARHIHQTPVPVVGGLAMIAGLVCAMLLSLVFEQLDPALQRTPFEHQRLALLAVGGGLIALVSFIDDIRDLPALPRLAVHIIAALIAVGPYLWDQQLYPDALGRPTEAQGIILTAFNFPFVEQIHLHEISPLLAIGATVFWIVGMQNMVNWTDGLDGLAGGIVLIAGTVLAFHTLSLQPPQSTIALLPLALAGACFGFLLFNTHPARIFMGDVGAMTIGYVLGASAIIGGAKLATALLVMSLPLVDMAWLIVYRLLNGRSAADAGRDHLHHRLLALGLSQRQVVALYYVLSALFGSIALLDWITPLMKLAALLLIGSSVLAMLIWAARRNAVRSVG
jgi:UDP-GlcNAc:undecaprenyl-phosphate/decaprenyl-phosphate GlcNAc-1-phosphate transferase